jgi:hypothetical protein
MTRSEHHGRTDLRKAAMKRLRDAKALAQCNNSHGRGAMYLAGYAIECKLKAIAMEVFGCWTLADLAQKWSVDEHEVYTHGLERLVRRLPLWNNLRRSAVWRPFARVNQWRPSWRYNPHDVRSAEAKAFVQDVEAVYKWLESNSV